MTQTKANETADIILASESPRRRELLTMAGLKFRIYHPKVEEKPRGSEPARDYARRNAVEKARAVFRHLPSGGKEQGLRHLIIAADTVVVVDDRILEKPLDDEHARAMLQSLSGRWHKVITGICVIRLESGKVVKERSLTVRTEVEMKHLTEAEIAAYIATGEPKDKAGAYAVQGRAAYMIRNLRGSYTNVVGLPVCELVEMLQKEFGYTLV